MILYGEDRITQPCHWFLGIVLLQQDKISMRRQQLTIEIYVLDLPKSRVGAKLVPQYCKDITPQKALDLKHARKGN